METYHSKIIWVFRLGLMGDVVDVLMGRRCYALLRSCHDVPIIRRGDVPLRRIGDAPPRRRWMFHLRCTCDVAGTYINTSLGRRHDVLLPGGAVSFADSPFTDINTVIIRGSRPVVFCKKGFLYKFSKIRKKTPALKTRF